MPQSIRRTLFEKGIAGDREEKKERAKSPVPPTTKNVQERRIRSSWIGGRCLPIYISNPIDARKDKRIADQFGRSNTIHFTKPAYQEQKVASEENPRVVAKRRDKAGGAGRARIENNELESRR